VIWPLVPRGLASAGATARAIDVATARRSAIKVRLYIGVLRVNGIGIRRGPQTSPAHIGAVQQATS
jgi:hypothetical protein